jgi:hypothetical protein
MSHSTTRGDTVSKGLKDLAAYYCSMKTYYTLFKTNGEVIELACKPPYNSIKNMLDCCTIEECSLGVNFNGNDHHDAWLE